MGCQSLDVSLIGGIVEQHGIVLQGEVDPLAQFFLAEHRSRGVVGVAQIDHVYAVVGQLRYELILGGAGKVRDVGPPSVRKYTGTPYHGIGVDIDGIDRIGDGY